MAGYWTDFTKTAGEQSPADQIGGSLEPFLGSGRSDSNRRHSAWEVSGPLRCGTSVTIGLFMRFLLSLGATIPAPVIVS